MNTNGEKKVDFGANVHLRYGVRTVDEIENGDHCTDQVMQSVSASGKDGQRERDISLNRKYLSCLCKLPAVISQNNPEGFQLKDFCAKSRHKYCNRSRSDKIQTSTLCLEDDGTHNSSQISVKHAILECHMTFMLPFTSLLNCDQLLQSTGEKDSLWRDVSDVIELQLTAGRIEVWRNRTQLKVFSCYFFNIIHMLAARTTRLALLPLHLFCQLFMSSALTRYPLFTVSHLVTDMPDIRSHQHSSFQQTDYVCGKIALESFEIKIDQFSSSYAKARKIEDSLCCRDSDRVMLMNPEKVSWVRKNSSFSYRDNPIISEKLAEVSRGIQKEKPTMDIKKQGGPQLRTENGEPSGADSVFSCPDISQFLRPQPLITMVYPVHYQTKSHQAAQSSHPHHSDRSQQARDETNIRDDYRQEIRRLASFSTLPATTKFFVIRLASAGFYYSEDGKIRCFFCKLEKSEWKQWDQPMQVHQQLRPQCPLVSGINCENVPIALPSLDTERKLRQFWSLTESRVTARSSDAQVPVSLLQSVPVGDTENVSPWGTYVPGSVPTMRQDVSASNISSSSTSQPVQLGAACSALLVDQSFGQSGTATRPSDAESIGESQSHSISSEQPASTTATQQLMPSLNPSLSANHDSGPSTIQPFCTSAPNVDPPSLAFSHLVNDGTSHPESRSSELGARTGEGQQVVTYQQLGILTELPKHPNMTVYQARMNSFNKWPSQNNQTPADLVQAGFFYAGYGDCGRCFFCGGGLKNWEANDNPWVEHARWFPRCAYIRLCRGQDFIDVVQFLNNRQQHITIAEVEGEINSRRADGERLEEPVMDPAVRSVLELGYAAATVETAVQQLRQQGMALTAAHLIDFLHREAHLTAGGDDAGDAAIGTDYIEELGRENGDMRQQHICKICLDRDVCIVFLPCGHLVCCAECSPALTTCPVCRQRIKGRIRAFSP